MKFQEIFHALQDEISSPDFQTVYQKAVSQWKEIKQIGDPNSLVSEIHSSKTSDSEKEQILSNIWLEWKESKDSRWQTLLLAVMFPRLVRLFKAKQAHHKNDPDDLWETIVQSFLEVIATSKRTDYLLCNFLFDTRKLVGRWEVRFFPEYSHEFVDEEILSSLPADTQEISMAQVQIFLEQAVQQEIISSTDAYLIMATEIYELPIKNVAAELKASYTALRKQKNRALAKLRRFLSETKGEKP